MDLATVVGIIVGLALIGWSMFRGEGISMFWDPTSLVVVMGGTLAAVIINFKFDQLARIGGALKVAFTNRTLDPGELISTLVSLAERARREGLLALEDDIVDIDDPFLTKGLQLVVDGSDPELISNVLETELTFLEERHRLGRGLFETMGTTAPAFGMVGTLMGLIKMLKNLNNPEAIGPGLALALLTTLYGALMANLLFNPIAGKLKVKSAEEVLMKSVMIEGILSILAGDNPRIVEEKLKAFLSTEVSTRIDVRGRSAKAGDIGEAEVAAGE